ncbi:CHAT domain-containing protein [Streptomyces sp. MNU76]|uniref:CHAT domain-containing tetratricopeptide repeat protein n=1 Tax=Streptomyces sp. MNU76 TaxID=2560026 RepID=UPI001E641BAA|nr:CHAT domain-containing protein [Streptomyces sp. MNU76]MCC9709372.1 CHAT domain-containing protein [Streptomyces sp. MNU76]
MGDAPITDRERLIANLEERIRRAEAEASAAWLMEPAAKEEAAQLCGVVPRPEDDVDVCQVLARFHTLRHSILLARSPETGAGEVPAMVRFQAALYLHDPHLVPDPMRHAVAVVLDALGEAGPRDGVQGRGELVERIVSLLAHPDVVRPADGGRARVQYLRQRRDVGTADPHALEELAALLLDGAAPGGTSLDALTEAVECFQQMPSPERYARTVGLQKTLAARARRLAQDGRVDEAVADGTQAMRLARLILDSQDPLVHRVTLARAVHLLAKYVDAAQRPSEALEWLEEAVSLYVRLAKEERAHRGQLADAHQDRARVLRTIGRAGEALESARRAVDGFRAVAEEDPEPHVRHLAHWHLAHALEEFCACLSALDRDAEAIEPMNEAVGLLRDLAAAEEDEAGAARYTADLAEKLCHLGQCLSWAGQLDEAAGALGESVAHFEQLIEHEPDHHREAFAEALVALGTVHRSAGLLDEACSVAGRAVELARGAARGGAPSGVMGLARVLLSWSEALADVNLFAEAEEAACEAVDLWRRWVESDPAHVLGLSVALEGLAARRRVLNRGEEAVAVAREAVALRRTLVRALPRSLRGAHGHHHGLAVALRELGESLACAGRHAEAAGTLRRAAALLRALAQRDVRCVADQVRAQMSAAQQLARVGRHAEALDLSSDAADRLRDLSSAPGDWSPPAAHAYGTLASVLSQCGRTDEAVDTAQECVTRYRTLAGGPAGGHYQGELGVALLRLAACLKSAGRLREALTAAEDARGVLAFAVTLSYAGFAPHLAKCLSERAECLVLCRQFTAALDSSARAVDMYRELARSLPDVYEPGLVEALGVRSAVLHRASRQEAALDAAVEATALARRIAARNRWVYGGLLAQTLLNEAAVLSAVHRTAESTHRAEGAVKILRELVARSPAVYREFLASALQDTASALTDADRPAEGLVCAQEAVDLYREDAGRGLPAFRSALAGGLATLANLHSVVGRPDEGLSASEEAVTLFRELAEQDPHPYTTILETMRARHGVLLGLCGRLGEAEAVLRQVVASPTVDGPTRVTATTRLGRVLSQRGDTAGSLWAYERAVAELPELPFQVSGRWDRELGLASLEGLGPEAAAAALSAGEEERALVLLERARTTLLAGRIREWDSPAPRWPALGSPATAPAPGTAQATPPGRENPGPSAPRSSSGVKRTVDMTRADFGAAAGDGVIVVVNVSRLRCDALLIGSGAAGTDVRVLPLDITFHGVVAQCEVFRGALAAAKRHGAPLAERRTAWAALTGVLAWLWEHVGAPVVAEVDRWPRSTSEQSEDPAERDPAEGEAPRRVWWCPTGPMTLLPLHACGTHEVQGASVPDSLVSSLIPSITVLAHARRAMAERAMRPQSSLVVAVPGEPGQESTLEVLDEETAKIPPLLPDPLYLRSADATKDVVLRELASRSVLHFACHCVTEPVRPSASRLVLHDQTENPLTALDLSEARTPQAQLAFLTACSTADSQTIVIDEALHMAGAFQAAGVPHVIATMWPVTDNPVSHIAPQVYASLADGTGRLRVADTARALREHVRELRERYPRNPTLWANYVHLGP